MDSVARWIIIEAHHHPRREHLTDFELGIKLGALDYFLRHDETGELYQVVAIHISGDFRFQQDEIELTLSRLGNRMCAST
ncbi:hypothetical protein DFJ67_3523 [Asanoa ferruginea]|uniref:Uncharacterized protein n=1 Tax=Asanoa ferruginea TaxID=53367 RepID=A0A3D9ZLY2_9ACTN|nr:hypothetical protein DFJ67_3523 [Asanoa ferruginea]GIF48189.1 hypothetical protein Afe04nite_27280 [Asanoa ferruginea]